MQEQQVLKDLTQSYIDRGLWRRGAFEEDVIYLDDYICAWVEKESKNTNEEGWYASKKREGQQESQTEGCE